MMFSRLPVEPAMTGGNNNDREASNNREDSNDKNGSSFLNGFESIYFPIIVSTIPVIASTILVIADLIGNLHFFGLLLMMFSRLPVEPAMTGGNNNDREASNNREDSNDKNGSSFLNGFESIYFPIIVSTIPVIVSIILVSASTTLVIADLIGNLDFFGLLLMMLSRLPVELAMTEKKQQ